MKAKPIRFAFYAVVAFLMLLEHLCGIVAARRLDAENHYTLSLLYAAAAAFLALQFHYQIAIKFRSEFANRSNLILLISFVLGLAQERMDGNFAVALLFGLLLFVLLVLAHKEIDIDE